MEHIGPGEWAIVIIVLALAVLEMCMFIAVARNKRLSFGAKVLWLVAIVCCNPLAAAVYYVVHLRHGKPERA